MMPVNNKTVITQDNFWDILKELAKQYKKFCGNTPAEIIIVGGGSIVMNYGFRNATMDLDVILKSASGMKDAILKVSEKFNLPEDWMNKDFTFLSSYSSKIPEISKYYASLNNGLLEIRTVKSEYLIAMKMQSGRVFGNDLSDIIGILFSEKDKGNNITFDDIIKAGLYLYDNKFNISEDISSFVKECCLLTSENLKLKYKETIENSEKIRNSVSKIVQDQNISLNKNNAKEIANLVMHDILTKTNTNKENDQNNNVDYDIDI